MNCPVHGPSARCYCEYALALVALLTLSDCWGPPRAPTAEEKAQALGLAACVARADCGSDRECLADAVAGCALVLAGETAGAGGA